MEDNRNLEKHSKQELTDLFTNMITRVHTALGDKPFRPSRAMNVAFFDSFCVAVASQPNANSTNISSAYNALLNDQAYLASINDSTSAPTSVETRIRLASEALS